MSGPLRQALVGLLGTLAVAASLPWLIPLDAAAYRALQFARSCEFASTGQQSGLIASGALLLAGALLLRRGARLADWGRALAITASGALAVELLKMLFDRLRPNQRPDELIGNAFPSGHVTSTALIALALWTIARTERHDSRDRVLVVVLGAIAVASQAVSRLVFGAHWPSDVIASILLAIGWVGLGQVLAARPPHHPGRWALGALLVVAAVIAVPALRIPLPSAHEGATILLDFDRETDRAATRGDWRHGDREPAGTVAWSKATEGAIALPAPDAPVSELGIALRPTARGANRVPGCVVATISLNDWTAPPIALLTGWREVRLRPPPSAWRSEGNQLSFALDVDAETRAEPSDFGWLGVRNVRVARRD